MKIESNIIGLASDHAGFKLKEIVKAHLISQNISVKDFGTSDEKSCDYADFAHPLANEVNSGIIPFGITICGSGNGISMVANKYRYVRAALCWGEELAKLARSHNDANICSLPSRFVSKNEALRIIDAFINTPFEGGRHRNRIDKIART